MRVRARLRCSLEPLTKTTDETSRAIQLRVKVPYTSSLGGFSEFSLRLDDVTYRQNILYYDSANGDDNNKNKDTEPLRAKLKLRQRSATVRRRIRLPLEILNVNPNFNLH